MTTKPWYYEEGQGNFFNDWSVVHFGAGMFATVVLGNVWQPLVIHTLYEMAEIKLYPPTNRDLSLENHIGDTIAFFAGSLVASKLKPRKR